MSQHLSLDDPAAIGQADPGAMLAAVGTAGAQIREALAAWADGADAVRALAAQRPAHNIVIAGMGGSAMSGDLVRVMAADAPMPIHALRGYVLPTWVGHDDLVVAVSCSGATEETLSIARQAVDRGIRLVTIGGADSALAELATASGAPHLPVDGGGRAPRANMWALTVPALGVVESFGAGDLITSCARIADLIDAETAACATDVPTADNAAKQLATALGESLPMIWGCTPFTGVAAYRFMAQLAENADQPAVHGELPEANHNQVVVLAGESPTVSALTLVLLRDADEHPQVARRAAVSAEIAGQHGVPVLELRGTGDTPAERFATLVQRIDLASVYVALALGINPSDIAPITLLKERIAQ